MLLLFSVGTSWEDLERQCSYGSTTPAVTVAPSSSVVKDKSESIFHDASAATLAGNHEEAVRLYTSGLDILLKELHDETDETRKKELTRSISYYMNKAEQAKTQIAQSKNDVKVAPKPSHPPPPPPPRRATICVGEFSGLYIHCLHILN